MSSPHEVYVQTLEEVWTNLTGRLRAVEQLLVAEANDRPQALPLETLPPELRGPIRTFADAERFASAVQPRPGRACGAMPHTNPGTCAGEDAPDRAGRAPTDAACTAETEPTPDASVRTWVVSLCPLAPDAVATAVVYGGTAADRDLLCYRVTLSLLSEYRRSGGSGLLPVRVSAADLALKLQPRAHHTNPTLPDACALLLQERWRKSHPSAPDGADDGLEKLLSRVSADAAVLLIVSDWDDSKASEPLHNNLQHWQTQQRPLLLAGPTASIGGRFANAVRWHLPPAGAARKGFRRWAATALAALALGAGVALGTRGTRPAVQQPPVRYQGQIVVYLERTIGGVKRHYPLNELGALPMRKDDRFFVECHVEPPAHVYLVWVDPGRDVTMVYPWNPEEKHPVRPHNESLVGELRVPRGGDEFFTAPDAEPGVATLVMFARPTPLAVPDEEVGRWFQELPDLPLPPGGEGGVVWFENYREARDPGLLRTFKVVVSDDPFERWQGQLQKALGPHASFQKAVSFARTGYGKENK